MKAFDVAISYFSSECWIAKDIYTLLTRHGITCYCASIQRDAANGFLRKELFDIYNNSLLNVMIYSKGYNAVRDDSIVKMERNILFDRTIGRGDGKSLFILLTDSESIPNDLQMCLSHHLHTIGITGIEADIFNRVKLLKRAPINKNANYKHPPATNNQRGNMTTCSLQINPNFKNEKRWKKLGDILVDADPPPAVGKKVFLIPSGSVFTFLSHTISLRHDENLLEAKQKYSLDFYSLNRGTSLKGVIFNMKTGDVDYPTAYCNLYDNHLNDSWNSDETAK